MPPLSDEDYQALKRDIDAAGVLIPVEYDEDGNVLDGHHRVKICAELGITDWPKYIRKGLSEEGKFAHARQLNIARRHINQAQKRELIADQLKATPEKSNRDIASTLGVDHKTVISVRESLERTWEIPKLKKTVGKDGKARRKPKRKHIPTQHIPEEADIGELFKTAKVFRAAIAAARRIKRLDNLAEIAKGNKALDTSIRYPIIYADPPWRYENPPIGASNRSIENHFPTMTLDEICAEPVSELATEDAMLYLWATAPKLAECMAVIEEWGFEYRTNMVWDKVHIGMGYHARNQHELLLICKRGDIPPPQAGTQPSSVYREPRGKHSVKPIFFCEMIEAAYPQLPKIELFSRNPRAGWAVWGNQSEAA
jgi:N6-adenosine-specific RNA methylase IME4